MTASSPASVPSVLFVCLGNICRSPTAEGIARMRAQERGLALAMDSAGTSREHAGQPPDSRARVEAARRNTPIDDLRARQVKPEDFYRFDHIIAMDQNNLAYLKDMRPAGSGATLSLMLDELPERKGQDVADPWYGDAADFVTCWDECDRAVRALLDRIAARSDR